MKTWYLFITYLTHLSFLITYQKNTCGQKPRLFDSHFCLSLLSLSVLRRTNTLLEKVAAAVEQSAFYSALWGSILTSPAVRLPGVSFVLLHLNRKLSMEDQLYVIGSDIELMVHESNTAVQSLDAVSLHMYWHTSYVDIQSLSSH